MQTVPKLPLGLVTKARQRLAEEVEARKREETKYLHALARRKAREKEAMRRVQERKKRFLTKHKLKCVMHLCRKLGIEPSYQRLLELKALFDEFDDDGSGSIDYMELKPLLAKMQEIGFSFGGQNEQRAKKKDKKRLKRAEVSTCRYQGENTRTAHLKLTKEEQAQLADKYGGKGLHGGQIEFIEFLEIISPRRQAFENEKREKKRMIKVKHAKRLERLHHKLKEQKDEYDVRGIRKKDYDSRGLNPYSDRRVKRHPSLVKTNINLRSIKPAKRNWGQQRPTKSQLPDSPRHRRLRQRWASGHTPRYEEALTMTQNFLASPVGRHRRDRGTDASDVNSHSTIKSNARVQKDSAYPISPIKSRCQLSENECEQLKSTYSAARHHIEYNLQKEEAQRSWNQNTHIPDKRHLDEEINAPFRTPAWLKIVPEEERHVLGRHEDLHNRKLGEKLHGGQVGAIPEPDENILQMFHEAF